jgi:hypothetical protein
MKKGCFVLALALCAPPIAAQVVVRGAPSCGLWVQESGKKSIFEMGFKGWLVGYLSGMASMSNDNILQGVDNDSIFLWMENYCRTHPLEDVSDGGEALFNELKSRLPTP